MGKRLLAFMRLDARGRTTLDIKGLLFLLSSSAQPICKDERCFDIISALAKRQTAHGSDYLAKSKRLMLFRAAIRPRFGIGASALSVSLGFGGPKAHNDLSELVAKLTPNMLDSLYGPVNRVAN
jgi:hypothetical protein